MIGKKVKLLEQNIGKYLPDFEVGKDDLNRTQILNNYKTIIKLDFLTLRTFIHQKMRVKREAKNCLIFSK